MSNNVLTPATNASNPQQELDALLALVSNLTQLSLDMTRLCIDVQSVVPGIALSKRALEMTSACLDVKGEPHMLSHLLSNGTQTKFATPLLLWPKLLSQQLPLPLVSSLFDWVQAQALTPDQLEASYAKGVCDNVAWQVVCIGREPGMYIDPDDAKANVEGVPSGFRKKKDSRLEALAFYRARYEDGKVQKWRAVPIRPASVPAPDNAPATLDPASEAHAAALAQSSDDEPELLGWVSGDKNSVRIKQ
ncbi:hypothetical protein C8R43DRAFT_959823 [Mycena crocata]|nr:hypothetical protein C8R43DRAFT_959823 [Mycena crocata]